MTTTHEFMCPKCLEIKRIIQLGNFVFTPKCICGTKMKKVYTVKKLKGGE